MENFLTRRFSIAKSEWINSLFKKYYQKIFVSIQYKFKGQIGRLKKGTRTIFTIKDIFHIDNFHKHRTKNIVEIFLATMKLFIGQEGSRTLPTKKADFCQ